MRIIIVGGGETGRTLANLLVAERHTLTLVEKDDSLTKDLADQTDALIIKGDGTDLSILKDAGIESADALVAVTNDDKTNLMVCEIAKSAGVSKTISRVNSTANEELFTKMGVTSIVPTVGLTITAIKRELSSQGARVIAQLGDGDTEVIELSLHPKSKLIGKSPFLKGAAIGAIYRNGEILIPKKSHRLVEGDVLILMVKSKDVAEVTRQISVE